MNAAPVDVRRLTKRYGGVTVVDDVSFTLEAGTITGFLGPNGAGKTSTMRMMLGLSEPTSGSALFTGTSYRDLQRPMETVGAVLESSDFHPQRSGLNHLRVLAAQAGLGEERIAGMLETVGLAKAAHRPVRTYSLGMRQRLGLAGALLGSPQILLLDEPANGLDPAGVAWLRSLLRDFADHGGTALVSSHLLAELAQSVDRVLIISEGKLLADPDLSTLQRNGMSLEDAYLRLTSEVPA
jgi:ABC-2 type transport system ATP-binding protein